MNDTIETTYRDHVITYNETANEWRCESFASHRGSPSLALAKSRINKMLDTPDGKPAKFEKFQVWSTALNCGGVWEKITITGKAEQGQLWATDGDKRRKLNAYQVADCKTDCPQNDALVASIVENERQTGLLRDEREKLEMGMVEYQPSK